MIATILIPMSWKILQNTVAIIIIPNFHSSFLIHFPRPSQHFHRINFNYGFVSQSERIYLLFLKKMTVLASFLSRNRDKHPDTEMAKFAVFALECIKRTRPRYVSQFH